MSENTDLRELLEKASPAPWEAEVDDSERGIIQGPTFTPETDVRRYIGQTRHTADRVLICALRNAAPALLDEIERLKAAGLVLTKECDSLFAQGETAERERDAYRKAKQENDERFMCERDEARAEVERLRKEIDCGGVSADGDGSCGLEPTRICRACLSKAASRLAGGNP